MLSEESRDTEDWRYCAEFSFAITAINYIKYLNILNNYL